MNTYSRCINWLLQREKWKILSGFTIFGVIAVFFFCVTVGFLAVCLLLDGSSWVTTTITWLGILYIIFTYLILSYLSMDNCPEPQGSVGYYILSSFLLVPLIATFACGIGLFGSMFLLSVIYPKIFTFSPFNALYQSLTISSNSQLLVDPTATFLAVGMIVGFYFLFGLVGQLIGWVVNLVKKGRKERRKA